MSNLAYSGKPTKANLYEPADFMIAPIGSGHKADYYTDGTNDEVQINAAITAANALTNGGTVELMNGTYTIGSSIVPLNNVWLRGQGMFSTKITQASGATYSIIDNYNSHSAANPWLNGIISDLELDGSNMSASVASKGINSNSLNNCKFIRIYCHDTTATGLGADDFYGSSITECIVQNCGYVNKHTITAASWSSNTFSYTTADSHGYSIGSVIVIAGMIPTSYNGRYVVTTVPTGTTFTIDASNNSGNLTIPVDPGTATTLGNTSDSLIGHNGIGIASGANYSEANIITNNFCFNNQNNNYLIEADNSITDSNASYIFSNNVSVSAGQCGFRDTGTPNVQFNNNYDYGSPTGAYITNVTSGKTITAASWSGGVATYTTSASHGFAIGTRVSISGMTPSGYNGYYSVASIPTSTTFTVAIASNPGTATIFGNTQIVAHGVNGTQVHNNEFVANVLYGIRIDERCTGVTCRSNNIKDCVNYGAFIGSGDGGFTQNRVHDNGIEGLWLFTSSTSYRPLDNYDISDNHVYNNGKLQSNKDGISVNSNVNTPITNLTIHDNHVYDSQTTPTQRYGIIIRSGGNNSNVSVTGNSGSGNTSAAIYIQDTSSTIWCYNNPALNPVGKSALGNITGTVTFDCRTANYFTGTLTGNVTASFPTQTQTIIGSEMTLVLTQDATGGRTLTLPSNAVASYGGLTLSTAAGVTDSVIFKWDGSKWRETTRSMNRGISVAEGGTGTTTSTGTAGNVVLSNSPTITTPSIAQLNDGNGNPYLKVNATASAIGGFAITNNVSGATVTLANANTGNSATIFQGAGTGLMAIQPATNSTNAFRFRSAGGTNTHMSYDSSNGRFGFGSGTAPSDTVEVTGNVSLLSAGNKLKIATGSNASVGTGTLAGGTVTISTTAVTANSLIFLTDTAASLTNVGVISVSSKVAGTSFTVTSGNALDTSTFNWMIIN